MGSVEDREGFAVVRDCHFTYSEAPAIVMQNLFKAELHHTQARRVDALCSFNWCDFVETGDCEVHDCTSDGVHAINVLKLVLSRWQVHTARQGYTLLGVGNATISESTARDCAYGYAFALSPVDLLTPNGNIEVLNSGSNGCLTPFAIGSTRNLLIHGGDHLELGAWYRLYEKGDFHHGSGIKDVEKIVEAPCSINIFDQNGQDGLLIVPKWIRGMSFQGVKMYLSQYALSHLSVYEKTPQDGVEYFDPFPLAGT